MRTLLILFLLLISTLVYALNGTFISLYSEPAIDVTPAGSFPAWIEDMNHNKRTELYLGEYFYIVFDLRNYKGTLYVVIRFDDGREIVGLADGGWVYGFPMRIVEPISEGKTYTTEIEVYNAAGRYLGSATVKYVERYCPDFEIESISWDRFVVGRTANVNITLRNKGEAKWTYRVEIWSINGGLKKTAKEVSVGAKSTATVSVQVQAASYQKSDQMVVRVSCAGGMKPRDWTYQISVLPPRPGPIAISAGQVEAKLGQQATFTITLRNLGYDAEILSVALSEGEYRIDAPNRLGTEAEAPATVYFTPARAGLYNITIRVKYKSPATGEVYEDSASIPVKVYALLAVEAVDHLGRPVSVSPKIAGANTNEAWLLPGRYRVEVPVQVVLSNSERLTFATWSTGAEKSTIEVNLEKNTKLRAVYNREYKVVVDLSPALRAVERWVREGDVFTYQAPQHVDISQDARWALEGFLLGGRDIGASLSFTVTGPAVVNAKWHKEYKITVDCGAVRCVEGSTSRSYWVREGDVFTIRLAQVDQINARERWRLEDDPEVKLTVKEPAVIRPRYVREYLVNFGYKIRTVEGIKATNPISSQWIQEGATLRVDVERLRPVAQEGVDYRAAGIEVDGSPASPDITVTRPHDVYVLWDEYYYVDAFTPIGRAYGTGWYRAGEYATIGLSETVSGFLVYDRFKMWVADDGSTYQEASITLKVDRPIRLTAVWERDYTQAIALAGGAAFSGVAYLKRDVLQRTFTRTRSRTRRVELEELDKTRTWAKEEDSNKKD